jgi:hypothetical protein
LGIKWTTTRLDHPSERTPTERQDREQQQGVCKMTVADELYARVYNLQTANHRHNEPICRILFPMHLVRLSFPRGLSPGYFYSVC